MNDACAKLSQCDPMAINRCNNTSEDTQNTCDVFIFCIHCTIIPLCNLINEAQHLSITR